MMFRLFTWSPWSVGASAVLSRLRVTVSNRQLIQDLFRLCSLPEDAL